MGSEAKGAIKDSAKVFELGIWVRDGGRDCERELDFGRNIL